MISKLDPRRTARAVHNFCRPFGRQNHNATRRRRHRVVIIYGYASIFRAAEMLAFIFSGLHVPSSDEKQEHSRVTAPE